MPPTPPYPLWKSGDEALAVEQYNYWTGSWRWHGVFAELSMGMQTRIQELVVVDNAGVCTVDNHEYRLTIYGTAPPRDHYGACAEEPDSCFESVYPGPHISPPEVVSCATLLPFVDLLPCVSCTGGIDDPCPGAAEISADDGCEHNGEFEDGFDVTITAPGTYEIGSGDSSFCGSTLTLSDENGPLKTWSSVCPMVTHTFSQPGIYNLDGAVPWLFVRSAP